MSVNELQGLFFIGFGVFVWFAALRARLYTLAAYLDAEYGEFDRYSRRIGDQLHERLYVGIAFGVLLLVLGLLYATAICRDNTIGDNCSTIVAIAAGINVLAAPSAWIFQPRLAPDSIERHPSRLLIVLAGVCSVLLSILCLMLCFSVLSGNMAEMQQLRSSDPAEAALGWFVVWPVFGGGLISLLVAIIVVPLVNPLVVVIESALGIRAE